MKLPKEFDTERMKSHRQLKALTKKLRRASKNLDVRFYSVLRGGNGSFRHPLNRYIYVNCPYYALLITKNK